MSVKWAIFKILMAVKSIDYLGRDLGDVNNKEIIAVAAEKRGNATGRIYLHEPQKKPYFWEEVDGDDERLLPRVHRAVSCLNR